METSTIDILASFVEQDYANDSARRQSRVIAMLFAQNALNRSVHNEWYKQGWPWQYAIVDECQEYRKGTWEWWKQSPKLTKGERLFELIDILHFGLSIIAETMFSDGKPSDFHCQNIAEQFVNYFENDEWDITVDDALDNIISDAINGGQFNLTAFMVLCRSEGISDIDDLFSIYSAKCLLNQFRQDNGYKEGIYRKNWNGHKDEEILYSIISDSSTKGMNDIYIRLVKAYNTALINMGEFKLVEELAQKNLDRLS